MPRLSTVFMKTLLIFAITLTLTLASFASFARNKKSAAADNNFVVTMPVHEDVCFSPDEHCDAKLVKLIQSAQKSIDVAIFDINIDQVVHELLVKSKKIPVRFIVDRRMSKGKYSSVPLLKKAGAQVRYGRQRGIMHNKFIIVDGKMIELGSFNFTNGAAFKNQENQLYLTSPKLIQKYQDRFNKMWAEAGEPLNDAREKQTHE